MTSKSLEANLLEASRQDTLRAARAEVKRIEEKNKKERIVERDRQREEERIDRMLHKANLERKYDLTEHPKRDKLYELAWEHGHSSGFTEVENYYGDFAQLLVD